MSQIRASPLCSKLTRSRAAGALPPRFSREIGYFRPLARCETGAQGAQGAHISLPEARTCVPTRVVKQGCAMQRHVSALTVTRCVRVVLTDERAHIAVRAFTPLSSISAPRHARARTLAKES